MAKHPSEESDQLVQIVDDLDNLGVRFKLEERRAAAKRKGKEIDHRHRQEDKKADAQIDYKKQQLMLAQDVVRHENRRELLTLIFSGVVVFAILVFVGWAFVGPNVSGERQTIATYLLGSIATVLVDNLRQRGRRQAGPDELILQKKLSLDRSEVVEVPRLEKAHIE